MKKNKIKKIKQESKCVRDSVLGSESTTILQNIYSDAKQWRTGIASVDATKQYINIYTFVTDSINGQRGTK